MKKFRIILLVTLFISGCVYDSVVKNLIVVNNSKDPIVFLLTNDTIEGEEMLKFRIASSYEDDLKKDFVILPQKEGYLISNGSWDYLVDKDTSIQYLYIIDIKKLDSLKKIESDTNKIRRECLTIQKYTYKKLQKQNWKVEYYGGR